MQYEVNQKNLVAVRKLCEIPLYKRLDGPITTLQMLDCDWSIHKFVEANFSKLTDNNHIFRNDFDSIHYDLCKISSPIIECKILAPYDFLEINSL